MIETNYETRYARNEFPEAGNSLFERNTPDGSSNTNHSCQYEFVRAADCRLRVKHIRAERRGPVLVFLHEGLGCIELWRDFPDALCEAVSLPGMIYDRRGYGGSDKFFGKWNKNYLETEALTYLPEVLNACGIRDAILIGHSDGGSIALIAAATPENSIRAVITEAAHIFVEDITLAGIRKTVKAYETTNLREKLAKYHGDNTETAFWRWADTWLDPDFRDWNIEPYLPRITCPLLILQGEDDEYATTAQVEGIASGVSGQVRKVLIPRSAHVPHVQARDMVLEEMRRFVSAQLVS